MDNWIKILPSPVLSEWEISDYKIWGQSEYQTRGAELDEKTLSNIGCLIVMLWPSSSQCPAFPPRDQDICIAGPRREYPTNTETDIAPHSS